MKIIFKKLFFIGLIIFLLMQLYQPARNLGYEQDLTANFTKVYTVPKNVKTFYEPLVMTAIATRPIILGIPTFNQPES